MMQRLVRVQIAMPFGVMCAGLRAAAGSRAARNSTDKDIAFDETGLAARLARDGVRRLWVGGLALDVCVRESVLDALRAGFEARVIVSATRPVSKAAGRAALEEMQRAGARLEGG